MRLLSKERTRLLSRANRIRKERGYGPLLRNGARHAYHNVKGQLYRIGSGRECPICGFTGRRFQEFGNPPRPDAQCPTCLALERHRLLWVYLQNETDVSNGAGRLLYFAPKSCIEDGLRDRSNLQLVTTDLMMNTVDAKTDITRLPFSTSTFDIVICSHVLEHVPEDGVAISELHRVVKEGGCAVILVPKYDIDETHEDESITSPEGREEAFGQHDHVRKYGRDFEDRLAKAGFSVNTRTYAHELEKSSVEKMGLESDDIHECIK